MNPEIESALNKLLDRPSDEPTLRHVQEVMAQSAPLVDAAVKALDRHIMQHRERGNPQTALALVEAKLRHVQGDGVRADALAQKGKILEEDLLDQAGALDAYGMVLELRPDDQDVEEAREELAFVAENLDKVVAKWVEEAGAASDPQVATRLYCSAAEACWRSDPGHPQIEELLRKSLSAEPRNWRSAGHLERFLRREGRVQELADLLEQRAEGAATRGERLSIYLTLGGLYLQPPFDGARAVTCFKNILEIEPDNTDALSYLVDALTAREDWQGLVEVYEGLLKGKPSRETEVGTLVQIGLLYDQKLQQPDRAEEYFRRVRKYDPTQAVLIEFYRRYYRDRGEADKLLALLDAAQRMESDQDRRVALAREMAELAENEVNKVDKAIDIWKGLLRMDPANVEAKHALGRLYRTSSPPKWNALRELLKEELEALPDERVDEKIALLQEVVEIYRDNLRLDVMVINTYNQILALKPDHEEALAALTEKYQAMGRWNDLIGLLMKRKDAETDPARKVDTLHEVARLWVEKFGNHSQAIKPLEEILDIDPVEERALEQLRDIHTRRRNWRELLELSRREAEHRTGDRQRELFKSIAALATEKLGDAGEGIQVWNRVLEEDPTDEEALEELSGLYRKVKRWPALAEVLRRRVDVARGESGELALLTELGDLYTGKLAAEAPAIEVWQRVLELDPGSRKARDVLRDLYVRQERWEELESLFAAQGDYARLAETLAAAGDRAQDEALKARLFTRVAEVQRDQLGDQARAMKSYERVLDITPDSIEVARALIPLYRDGQKWNRLLSAYQVLLDQSDDRGEKLELLAQIRIIAEQELGAKSMAFKRCAEAYALAPEDEGLRLELERLAGEAGEWEELCAIYTDRVGDIEDPYARADLLRKLAELSEEKLGHPDEAEVFHRDILGLFPEDMDALEALERIYTQQERWPALVEIFGKRVDLEGDPDRQVELLFRVAKIQEERVGDPEAAVAALERVAEIRPDSVDALESLARLHELEADYQALAEVLGRRLDLVAGDQERAEVMHRLGETLQTRLEDHDRAVEYFSQVLSLVPAHGPTVEALERYLALGEDNVGQVARLLQPVYEAQESWSNLAEVMEIVLRDEQDESVRIALLRRLMDLEGGDLARPAAAFEAGAQLMALDPDAQSVRKEMGRLADELGRVEELAELYRKALESDAAQSNPSLELALSWELASLLDDRLGEPAQAEPYLRRVVEVEPGHRAALDLLERILRDMGKWSDLRDLLVRRKDLEADAEARRNVLLQICSLNEEFLEDVPAAILAFEEVLELEPDNSVALKALERHYADAGRWSDLLELLQREQGFAEEEAALGELKFRQAEIMARHLDDPVGAVDLLEEVVGADPAMSQAVALLEELMEQQDLRRRITEVLESVYERLEAYGDLVRVLRLRRELAQGPFEAVELLTRAAGLQEEKLADPIAAFESYREALALEPSSPEIHEAIERLATDLSAWQEAAGAWKDAFEAADPDDVALRARLQMKLARVHDEKLEDEEAARGAYERLMELDPHDPETAQPAAVALARLYEQASMWNALIGVIRKQLAWEQDPKQREAFLVKICRIQEDVLGDIEAAITTYSELLNESPGSEEALHSLERLFLQEERWSDLVDVYRRRVEAAQSPERRRDLWVTIAGLYEDQLGNVEEAVVAYLTVLDEVPDDLETIRALARIYQETERWEDLLEMLERELSLARGGDDERLGLVFRIATIHHRNLKDLATAIGRYREVLELDPGHAEARAALEEMLGDAGHRLDAAALLAPVYEAESDWERLIGIYELQAEDAVPAEKVRLLREIARLWEDGLDNLEEAFGAYRRLIRDATTEPDFLAYLDEFQRIARTLERWEPFVATIEEVVLDVMDPEAQRTLYLAAAEVSRDHLQDLERAKRHFQSVLDADPGHAEALSALDALYDVLEEWEPLLEVLQRRGEMAGGDDERATFFKRSAALCRDRLENPQEAIANYERVLDMVPDDPEAIDALDALYATCERWSDLAMLLERRLGFAGEAEQAELYFRLGQVRAERLSEAATALEAYQQVLDLDRAHEGAVAALEGYLDDADLQVEASRILEPIYIEQEAWERLIRILEIRLEAGDTSETRIGLLTRIARLYEEQVDDLKQAFVWYGKVFLEDPVDTAPRDQLLRLASVLDAWDEVADVLGRFLDNTLEDNATTREVAILLGTIHDEQLGKVDEATACYRRALAADRTDQEAFLLLEALLTRAERWHDVLELYQEMAEATLDPTGRRELLVKACRVWEEALGNQPEAIDAYKVVLEETENDEEAVAALDRLYTQTERWQDLCELLTRQCDFAEDEADVVALKYRVGTIYEREIRDLHTAVDTYEEVLQRDPQNVEAAEALERLMADRDQRFRVAQILEGIYKDRAEWTKLVDTYEAQLEFIEDRPRRVDLLREVARLHEEVGDDMEAAFKALSRALAEDFGDEDLLANLERLAEYLDNWDEVVATLRKGVEGIFDYDLQARMYAKIATLQEERLDDRASAVESWRRVFSAREDDQDALSALIRLLETLERHEELIDVLRRKAETAPDPEDQKQTYLRVARIHEDLLGQTDRATEVYRQILTVDEDDRTALDALERLYLQAENWMELIWVLRRKLELTYDPEERKGLQFQVAQVYEEQLHDGFEAITAYKALLAEDPTDAEILDALDRLYTQEELHADLLEVLELKIQEAADSTARCDLLHRAGATLERQIGDLDGAIERYRQVIEEDPTHAGAREALEALVRGESHREVVAEILERLYEATAEVEPLVEVLELRLHTLADPPSRRDLLMRISRLYEEAMDDTDRAFDAAARALAEDPGDEEVRTTLERLADVLADFGKLVAVYEARLEGIYDPELARELHGKVARLMEDIMGDAAGAERHYRATLEYGGEDDLDTLLALDRLLERQEKWTELAEILEQELRVVGDPVDQAVLYFRLGEIRVRENDDLDGGFAAFREALDRNPELVEAREEMERLLSNESYRVAVLDVLEPICEDTADHAKLVDLLETRLTTVADPEERIGLLERIAGLHLDALEAPDQALAALGRAMAEDPGNEQVLDRLEDLASAMASYDEVLALADPLLDKSDLAPDAKRTLGLRAAKWYGQQLSDIERAEQTLKKVLEVDPECAEALEELEAIYRAGMESEQLADVLWRRAELTFDPLAKRPLLSEVARIREEELGDVEGAVEAYRGMLDLDAEDQEALAAAGRLYEAQGAWNDLLEVLDRRVAASATDPDAQAEFKRRMGEVLEEKLEDRQRAVEAYRDVLDLVHDDATAIERLLALLGEEEDWTGVQEILMRKLEAQEPMERVETFFQLGDLCAGKLEAVDDAVGHYQEVLNLDPTNRDAVARLEKLLKKAEKWYELVEVLRKHAEIESAEGDVQAEVAQLVAAARVWNDRLENPDAAAEILEEILERDEGNVQALAGLARIYESTEQWDRCKEVLEKAASLDPEPAEAAELAFRVGRITLAQTGDEAAAAAHYLKALEHNPEHEEAARELEAHARKQGDWERVAELMELRANQVAEEEQLELLKELGSICSEKLDRPEESVTYLELARELSPDDSDVLAALADAYYGAGRYDDAAPLLEQLIAQSVRGRRKDLARYTFRMGTIAEKRGDAQGAREQYDKAYKLDSTHGPTQVALGRVYLQQEDWSNARRIYRSMLLQNIDESSGITKADIFHNLGLAHLRLGEGAKAMSMFERGLEVDPEHEGLKAGLEEAQD